MIDFFSQKMSSFTARLFLLENFPSVGGISQNPPILYLPHHIDIILTSHCHLWKAFVSVTSVTFFGTKFYWYRYLFQCQKFVTTSKMNIQMSIEMSCHCDLDFSDEHTTNQADQYHAGLKVIGKEQGKNNSLEPTKNL